VLSHLSAHDLWAQDIAPAPRVTDGMLPVPDAPGLGIAPDPKLIEELRSLPPAPAIRRISTVVYPSGSRWHFAEEQQRQEAFYFGHLPGFVPGVRLDVREDDGSQDFAALFERCREAPVVD